MGYTLVELVVATAIVATTAAIATPHVLGAADDVSTLAAARYVAGLLQQARVEAVRRRADVGLRFVTVGASYAYTPYVDGNANGLRTRDITNGTDLPLRPSERLIDAFPSTDFGALPGLPAVDTSSAPPGADPIRLGSGNLLTFTSTGTSSSGSLYVRGRRDAQYVVRVFGETGRVRVLRFNRANRQWTAL